VGVDAIHRRTECLEMHGRLQSIVAASIAAEGRSAGANPVA
jgi:hypothetical protein